MEKAPDVAEAVETAELPPGDDEAPVSTEGKEGSASEPSAAGQMRKR